MEENNFKETFKEYMEDLLDEQELIMMKIDNTRILMNQTKDKHVRDYYKRELNTLYDDLHGYALDILVLTRHLMED